MTGPLAVLVVVIVSAYVRLNAVLLGQPVSVPVIGFVAVAVVLMLAAIVLHLFRTAVRDGAFLYLRPRMVSYP